MLKIDMIVRSSEADELYGRDMMTNDDIDSLFF